MSVIEVKKLCKTFKTKEKEKGLIGSFKSIIKPNYKVKKAVNNISFEVEKGEVTYENYIRIDNTNLSPEEVANLVVKEFKL